MNIGIGLYIIIASKLWEALLKLLMLNYRSHFELVVNHIPNADEAHHDMLAFITEK